MLDPGEKCGASNRLSLWLNITRLVTPYLVLSVTIPDLALRITKPYVHANRIHLLAAHCSSVAPKFQPRTPAPPRGAHPADDIVHGKWAWIVLSAFGDTDHASARSE